METPYLPKEIFGKDFEKVYEPAEDTFILLDALEADLENLNKNALVCLECGSGSGTVITALSKSFTDPKCQGSRLMLATDINDHACKTTRKCAKYHNQPHIQVIRTNLAESLVDRLENQVDLLVFNPPYVPTVTKEFEAVDQSDIHLSWAGGKDGRMLIDEFLKTYVPHLLSKPSGVAYMVTLSQNNVKYLLDYLVLDHNIKGTIVKKLKAGYELLYVIRYEWVI